jgi:hypothetical protein
VVQNLLKEIHMKRTKKPAPTAPKKASRKLDPLKELKSLRDKELEDVNGAKPCCIIYCY